MNQPLRRCGIFASKNKIKLAHIFIVLTLFSVALWNAAHIVEDYMYDNRYTLVKLFQANETFPFLKDTSIRLGVLYSDRVIFQAQIDDYNNLLALNFSTDEDFFEFILVSMANITELTLNNRGVVEEFFSRIGLIDHHSARCIASKRSCPSPSDNLEVPYPNIFLNDLFYIENLEESLWKEMQNYIIYRSDMSDINSDITIVDFDGSRASLDIDLSAVLKPARKMAGYFVGAIVENKSLLLNHTIKHTIDIRLVNEELEFKEVHIEKPETTMILLRISNVGVYDKRKITPCTDEPAIYHHDFQSEPRCTLRQYLEIVADECNCVPFTYRRQFRKINTAFAFRNISYCTMQMYGRCFDEAQKAFAKRPSCLLSCTNARNQYMFSTTVTGTNPACNSEGDELRACSHAMLLLMCNDLTYTIYEERFQLTSSQLLSQVGGDLGLYTGISILGVWQFLMYVHYLHKRHQEAQRASAASSVNDATTGTSSEPTTNTVFALLSHYFDPASMPGRTDRPTESNNEMQAFEVLSGTKVTDLENKILSVKNDLEGMKTEMQMQTQLQAKTREMQVQLQTEMREQLQHVQQALHKFMRQSVANKDIVFKEQEETTYRM